MGLATRQWIILLTFYTTYLMFGACVFYHIEHNAETERRANDLQARIDINELLVSFTSPEDDKIQKSILDRVSSYCNKPVTHFEEDEFVNPYQWTFYHCVFFAFIVCSTLGYGNITPTNTLSRYFMIAYALIGMPVNMILYTHLGQYFGKNFIKVYRKYKAYQFAKHMQQTKGEEYMPPHWSMVLKITLSLVLPALIILVFLPSVIFSYFEGWDYSISVYYSFVTLLTIGFGDFVPTFQPHQEETFGVYFIFYQIFVLIWFVFGLSYILMLIGFIARGMQSKKIRRFEQQLADNIKLTHNRIWSGVSKDVSYLRRILNEVYIMRVRPVFTEPSDVQLSYRQTRSQSCPELTIYNCKSPVPRRKRAMSVVYYDDDKHKGLLDQRPLQLQSRHSETNLLRIDRQKTFEQTGLENTGELLAQVVFALNGFNASDEPASLPPPIPGGIDLFTDESILEDEWSIVTTPTEQTNQKIQRSRAKSLFSQISKSSVNSTEAPQFTWSGNNNDIQDYVNSQVKGDKITPQNAPKDNNAVAIFIDKEKEADSSTNRRKSVFTAFNNIFKRRNTLKEAPPAQAIPSNQLPIKAKVSPISELKTATQFDAPRKSIFNSELRRRPSILSNQSASSEQVLENTTIADLIRAIESAHVKNLFGTKLPENFAPRRLSMAPQTTRRSSVSFSSPLETPPSAGSKPMNLRKPSMAMPRNRPLLTMRQNSNPNRFSVTPVGDNASSALNSPIIQRRMRRFSAIPATTVMPPRKLSSSLHATPLALRRTQFKQTISPLAIPVLLPTPEAPSDSPHSTKNQ